MALTISDKAKGNPVIGSTLRFRFRGLKDPDGELYDLTLASKIYLTLKDVLAEDDASAEVQIDSVSNPSQFVLTYGTQGSMDIVLTPSDTSAVSAGTLYYVDVKAIGLEGDTITLLYDTLVFDQPVTQATS